MRLTCRQMRAFDRWAVDELGVPSLVLMENAGRVVAEHVRAALSARTDRVVILCGPGNNGGDGFVAARHLHNAGVTVAVLLAAGRDKSRGDAGVNLRIIEQLGLRIIAARPAAKRSSGRALKSRGGSGIRREAERAIHAAGTIVDALLGTGSSGAPRGAVGELIELANEAARATRIAVDIPSGLNADTGVVHEPCFHADMTVTLVAEKAGFAKRAARAALGRVVVADIGVVLQP